MLSSVLKSGALLTGGTVAAGLLSYGFIVLAARGLGPEEFGSLGVLLTFLYFASAIVQGVTTLVTRYAALTSAEDRSAVTDLMRSATLTVGTYSAAGFVIYLALSPLIDSLLDIDNLPAVITIGVVCLLRAFTGVVSGGLQGLDRFGLMSLAIALESALRFALGLVLMTVGFTLLRSTSAYAVAAVVPTLIMALMLPMNWRRFFSERPRRSELAVTGDAFLIGGSFLLIALLTQLDMVAAKYFLSAEVAGYYAAASNLVRAPFLMLAGAFAYAMYPSVVRAGAYSHQGVRLLLTTSAVVLAAIAIATATCYIVPQTIVGVLLGADFMPLAGWLGLFAAGSAAPALLFVVTRYHMACRPTLLIWLLLVGLVVELVIILLLHTSPQHVILATALGSLTPLLPLSVMALKNRTLRLRATGDSAR
ncbi:MAG: oligosaccharide flippase family protein [candidate division WS1 bacterium]|jgi:O-antigen/teichoic acid export membrane protein|nr:oligosaccharide flippase family protein [candidate division WS1 bacterium]